MIRWGSALGLLLMALMALTAWGQGAIDVFEFTEPDQRVRYQQLIEEFRCPKCLNTNLAGSDAPIAADLRRTVHELLLDGRTDAQIRAHLQGRYGDFVLYNPPLRIDTIGLWLVPAGVLVAGVVAVFVLARRRRPVPLGAEDRERIARLNERFPLRASIGDSAGDSASEPSRE